MFFTIGVVCMKKDMFLLESLDRLEGRTDFVGGEQN